MKTIKTLILLIFCAALYACGQKHEAVPVEQIIEPLNQVEPVVESWQKTDNRIAIVFGYGYTDSPFYENTVTQLETNFGLDKDDGLILPLAFPRDFSSQGLSGRISSLPDMLAGKNIKALILLGAPEGAHRALAVIQDRAAVDTAYSYPVFSLFSQDDILGTEAGSHVVIDFAPFGGVQGMGEEAGLQHLELIPEILVAIIKKASDLPQSASSAQIQKYLKSMLDKSWSIDLSIDPETALRSRNHFLISVIEKDPLDEPFVDGLSIILGN